MRGNTGGLPPLVAATIGALITTWATFTPCFLWIFLGGPYIEQLRVTKDLNGRAQCHHGGHRRGRAQSRGLVRAPRFLSRHGVVDWFAILLCAAAFVAMLRYKIDIIPVIIGSRNSWPLI